MSNTQKMTAINTTCLIFSLFAVVSCVIIHTPSGDVQGIEKNGYRVFKGIPYAEPPIRWKRPVPKQPWANIFNATSFGHECPQSNNEFTDKSEDCLFLNVWTPINSTNIPVMVYIHGELLLQRFVTDQFMCRRSMDRWAISPSCLLWRFLC